jgi:hypothetical protein
MTKKNRGGQNIQKIFLNIKTFKLFCIKAETKKANEIHEYFMKLEEIIQETINDETNQLRLQLQEINIILDEQPVIKVCCLNGEKTSFKTIADAARDCNISAPALRRRILTNVHINDHHWIFDKNANHYK